MGRYAAALVLCLGALLLTRAAAAAPDVPGDPTPPVVTPVIVGTLGANGWYTSNVTVNWSVTDPESVILSTTGCDATTLTTETVGKTLTCSATSDGGTTTVSKTFKLDKTPPAVRATPGRAADTNGWYNHALSVSFSATDGTSGVDSCVAPKTYSGPDNGSASVSGSCVDKAGNTGAASFALEYDSTAPAVTASAGRGPDANGWYNHALTVAFVGTDATAGIAGCSSGSYAGPDSASASVSGNCTDRAGNTGRATFPLEYDATPPTISSVSARARNRRIDLTWSASSDTRLVQVTRASNARGVRTATVYTGDRAAYSDRGLKVGARYLYTVTGFDQAGNSASKALSVTATGRLLSPAPGARVTAAPLLTWTPVKRARYYNVQLIRGRKILSVWPTAAHFQLRRTWVFGGHRYRLRRGVYRWYVWPGFGRLSANRYGRLLGSSSFVYAG